MMIKIKSKLKGIYKATGLFFLKLLHWKLSRKICSLLKEYEGIQLEFVEILSIAEAIYKFEKCNLLIFGMGNDSMFWSTLNSCGNTVFLEDHEEWYNKVMKKYPLLDACRVTYPTDITKWEELLDQPQKLAFELPPAVKERKWDVILVDGPGGYELNKSLPGRMSSIFASSNLVADNGYVFVHDAEREVEAAYSAKYLKNENLVNRTYGRALLNQYLIRKKEEVNS